MAEDSTYRRERIDVAPKCRPIIIFIPASYSHDIGDEIGQGAVIAVSCLPIQA